MIEATCAACGTVNRMAEADVPVGAKFVSCTSCKSKIALPARLPAVPAPARPGAPGKPVAIPAIPPKLPTPPKSVPSPAKNRADALDLADLPAPKRQSPLAGAEPSKPAPRSALDVGAELPAPKSMAKPPAPQGGSLDLDDLMPPADSPGLADLPAPKPRGPASNDGSKATAQGGLADLPAPKVASKAALADLPAPKASALTDLPAPKATGDLTDLPAPKKQAAGITDVPAPKAKAGLTNLPAPKASPAAAKGSLELDDDLDLPMPKAGITDLPTPKPGANNDLLAPKGFFDDLPQPAKQGGGTIDLPAPKGFFDDLPQPAKTSTSQDVAPKGFFDDLPQPGKTSTSQDVAPKGFFDDLPQPGKTSTSQDIAPKGFFDDLPQPAKPGSQQLAPKGAGTQAVTPRGPAGQELTPKGAGSQAVTPRGPAGQELTPKGAGSQALAPKGPATQELAPKGFFDDLPQPTPGSADALNLFDDLPEPPTRQTGDAALGAGDIDLGPALGGPGLELDTGGPGLDLGDGGGTASGPDLDLGLPLGEGAAFQDLDLSEPTRPKSDDEGSPIKIKTPAKGATPRTPIPINVPPPKGATDMALDLADDPHAGKGKPAAAAIGAGGAKITPKKKAAAAEDSAEARAAKRRRSRIVLASLLGVVALGAGGFYFYQRHAAEQAKQQEIAADLDKAEKALRADDPTHWNRALKAAEEAIRLDDNNPRALGIGAEAAIAGALDTGMNRDVLIQKGREMVQKALAAGRVDPAVDRAQAVAAITAKGQAQRATDLLRAQIAKAPKDGWLQLYMGWAQLAKGDAAEAVKAFDQASAMTAGTKLSALYGKGQAKLMLADVEGAKNDFAAVLQLNKDHVCANIGLIATKPLSESGQKVAELDAVLQRKDITTADPRCRVQAITLIGDVHRSAGRLDMARERYREALTLQALDGPAHDGLAAVELRDGKLALAQDHIQKALAVNADDADALLLQAEVAIKQGKLPDAEAQIGKLAERKPPLAPLQQARLHVVRGRLLEAKGELDAAIDEYVEGAKLAGEHDLTPTMLAVTKLAELAKKETDQSKAGSYRLRADQLLSAIAEKAQEDADLAATIGAAYLEAGDPVKAEVFLRRATAMKSDEPLFKLQLAKTLNAQGKTDDAISQLKEAQQLDPKSIDIALTLAKTYQSGNRSDDAIAAYEKLLAAETVPIVVRVDAGRFFARRGLAEKAAGDTAKGNSLIDKAAAQAEPILKAEPDNPGGLYLKAEGLIKAEKPDEARPLLVRASDSDPEAQYWDALGRAQELQYRKSLDGKYIEGARQAYERAAKADDKMFSAWLGQGKMLDENQKWDQAVAALDKASKLDPGNAEVRYYMGLAYYGLRNGSAVYQKLSAQWLESALKASPALDLALRAEAAHMAAELYDKNLNKPHDAVRSYEASTKLAEELEKQTGKAPKWLLDDLYELGDQYQLQHNKPLQKKAWQRFYARSPKDQNNAHWRTVNEALATSLKSD